MYMYWFINRYRIVTMLPTALLAVVLGISALTAQPAQADIFDKAKIELRGIESTVIGQELNEFELEESIGRAIAAALALVGVLFFALMIYGGYLWMTARGEKDQLDKAKQTIIAASIGIAITLGAYAVTTFVIIKITGASGLT